MRFLLALVVLQAACVSSSIELVEDTGPRVDVGTDVRIEDAGPDTHDASPLDSGCQVSAAPPLDCYEDCEEVEAEWNPETCEFQCDAPAAECFTDCSHDEDYCSIGFECCVGEECELIARNQLGEEELCDQDVPLEYGALCREDKCEVVDFTNCEEDDACVVVANEVEECGNLAINQRFLRDYLDSLCSSDGGLAAECCATIRKKTRPGQCNPELLQCEPSPP